MCLSDSTGKEDSLKVRAVNRVIVVKDTANVWSKHVSDSCPSVNKRVDLQLRHCEWMK